MAGGLRVRIAVPPHVANQTLAFLLEIVALIGLGWWGFGTGWPVTRVPPGMGATLLAAVVWGLFAAPRARLRLPLAGLLGVKTLIYAAATAALLGVGHLALALALAVAFAVIAAANTVLVTTGRRGAVRNRG